MQVGLKQKTKMFARTGRLVKIIPKGVLPLPLLPHILPRPRYEETKLNTFYYKFILRNCK